MMDESHFERFFAPSPALACLAGADGALGRLSPALVRFLGSETKSLRDQTHPEDWNQTTEALRSFAGFEHRLRNAAGEWRRLRWTVLPAPGESDEPWRLLVGEDVTESAEELEALRDQLSRSEKLTTLGQLTGSVAHELRNPLGVISNCVYYLVNAEPDLTEDSRECLRDIQRELTTANRIGGELLDFARPPKLDRQDLSAREVVDEALDILDLPAGIDLQLEIGNNGAFRADRGQIVRVLRNLMLNAIQAMEERGRLRVAFERTDEGVQFTVTDSGPGISPTQATTLFEPLVSTKARGIGLGLPLSRRYAELNGGSLDVDSARGDGATFVLKLPNEPPVA